MPMFPKEEADRLYQEGKSRSGGTGSIIRPPKKMSATISATWRSGAYRFCGSAPKNSSAGYSSRRWNRKLTGLCSRP